MTQDQIDLIARLLNFVIAASCGYAGLILVLVGWRNGHGRSWAGGSLDMMLSGLAMVTLVLARAGWLIFTGR